MRTLLRSVFVIMFLLAICFIFLAQTSWFQVINSKTHETSHPVTQEEVRKEVPYFNLPASASNIWYATSTFGVNLYRFDAPLADCLAYAQRLIATNNSTESTSYMVPTQLVAIAASPQAIDHDLLKKAYRLKGTAWFDVENVTEGWTGSGPPSGRSSFWIDAKRGRFYFYWTE